MSPTEILVDVHQPTLDAGTPALYQAINRPHVETTYERLLDGLIAFRKEYTGNLWVEVMLVRGLNDTEAALMDIAVALSRIRPDAVHIDLPTRPPSESWVQPPGDEGIMRAIAILGETARIVSPAEGEFDLSGYADVADAVVSIITRHPMREQELLRALERWTPGQVDAALARLIATGLARKVERNGAQFWIASGTLFPA